MSIRLTFIEKIDYDSNNKQDKLIMAQRCKLSRSFKTTDDLRNQ